MTEEIQHRRGSQGHGNDGLTSVSVYGKTECESNIEGRQAQLFEL
jgi:hypothetical protein